MQKVKSKAQGPTQTAWLVHPRARYISDQIFTKAQASQKFDEFWLTVKNDFNEKWQPGDIAECKKVHTMIF